MGWFLVIGGLTRMFAPAGANQGARNTVLVLPGQVVLLAIGIVLTFQAYRRGDD